MNRRDRRAAAAQTAETTDTSHVTCATHGKVPWLGTVICDKCGACWQLDDERKPLFAPETCTCGVRLVPIKGAPKGGDFSARICCMQCWLGAQGKRGIA